MTVRKANSESILDIRAIVRDMGGRSRIPGALREQHITLEVNEEQIDKWINRNSMPTKRLAELLLLAQIERRPININKYVKDNRQ